MEIYIYGGLGGLVLLIIIISVVLSKRSKNDSSHHFISGESDPKKDYYILSDILFHDGIRQAKIDQLVINTSGIHAILEFHYEGQINGNKDRDEWSFTHKGVSDVFESPIKTARDLKLSMDKALKKDYPLFIYIVFPKTAEFKRIRSDVPILLSNELQDEMNQNFKSKQKISSNDVKLIYDLFLKIKNR
ncbi:MAG: NERD domain-containing protein [Firmicutes bacterium]|nr:NERD domain-containing protein [Bacillota bacterium]